MLVLLLVVMVVRVVVALIMFQAQLLRAVLELLDKDQTVRLLLMQALLMVLVLVVEQVKLVKLEAVQLAV
jgi:hypothetical protein